MAQSTDRYGGVLQVTCPNGPHAHFYTQKIGDRWWLCSPAGHGFFMKGVVGVNYSFTPAWKSGALQAKYGSADNPYVASSVETPSRVWAFNYLIQQVNRLRAWGFNWLADGAAGVLWPVSADVRWNTPDHTIPDQYKMPFDVGDNTTRYAMLPQIYTGGCNQAYPLKDMINGVGSAYTAYRYNFADYFDPHFTNCIGMLWNKVLPHIIQSPHADYLIYIYFDEGDQAGLLHQGPDFPTINNNGVPNNPVSASAHPSWVTLATRPVQTSASALGHTAVYTDCKVYSKIQLIEDLIAKYGTIGALNQAWGSSYTGFWSSQNGYTSADNWSTINCSGYQSSGTGTGLLDEDGTCPSKRGSTCWMGDDITLTGQTTAMKADMSAFLTHYLRRYFSVETTAIHSRAPGVLTQMTLGGFGVPPRKEVLEVAGQYLDLPQLSIPHYCPACNDSQRRIDFVTQHLGDKPWMMWVGLFANPDSAQSAHVRADNPARTQEARGAAYQTVIRNMVSAKGTNTGVHPIVGFYWWDMYDSNGEGLNWGLLTPSDNAYNGHDAVIARGTDRWGYSTGGEQSNYGDFISSVEAVNQSTPP